MGENWRGRGTAALLLGLLAACGPGAANSLKATSAAPSATVRHDPTGTARPAAPSSTPVRARPKPPPVPPALPRCGAMLPAGTSTRTVAGRPVLVAVPESYDGVHQMPLVLVLPGYGQTPEALAAQSRLLVRGVSAGVLVAIPTGEGPERAWDFANVNGVDDVGFLRQTVSAMADSVCADRSHVVIAGISDGGDMAAQAICALPGVFQAVMTVASSTAPIAGCRPTRLLALHGDADPVDPYEGGVDGRPKYPNIPAATAGIAAWAAVDGCSKAQRTAPAADLLAVTYPCGAELITIHGGGHTWPGGAPADPQLGRTTDDLDASGELLELAKEAHSP